MGQTDALVFEPAFLERWGHYVWHVLGPLGSGKTTLLKALAAFFDERAEGACELVEGGTRASLRYPVAWLDFSDFSAASFADALAYFAAKMSALYLSKLEDYEQCRYFEVMGRYLDVIEGLCDEEGLSRSLERLVSDYRGYAFDDDNERILILIDEVTRPYLFAAKFGYLKEMRNFMDRFLDIDHYEMDAGIVCTSYAPANTELAVSVKYLLDEYVNDIEPLAAHCRAKGLGLEESLRNTGDFSWHSFDACVGPKDCFDRLAAELGGALRPSAPPKIVFDAATRAFVSDKRGWVLEKQQECERRERERAELERIQFAAPLSKDCNVPSKFAGARTLSIEVADPQARMRLNAVLGAIFERQRQEENGIRSIEVYEQMHNIEDVRVGEGLRKMLERLRQRAERAGCHHCRVDDDHHWGWFHLERHGKDKRNWDIALVKVYLTHRDQALSQVLFEDIVSYLIDEGGYRMHAKIARCRRDDHICLWVSRDDFHLVEDYAAEHATDLVCTLPFVAYRGKLGITREFCGWKSYNGVVSELIAAYLAQVDDASDIDVVEMYDAYVRAWNGDLGDNEAFTRAFKHSDAQELLVLLETLDVLLGNASLDDGHLLLNCDGDMWHALGSARNWFEVQQEFEEMSRDDE